MMAKVSDKSIEGEIKTELSAIRRRLGLPEGPVAFNDAGVQISQVDLNQIADNLEVTAPQSYVSHRKIVGPLVIWLKAIFVNAIMARVYRMSLSRQWMLNHHLYQTAAAVAELNEKIKALENRLATLESKVD